MKTGEFTTTIINHHSLEVFLGCRCRLWSVFSFMLRACTKNLESKRHWSILWGFMTMNTPTYWRALKLRALWPMNAPTDWKLPTVPEMVLLQYVCIYTGKICSWKCAVCKLSIGKRFSLSFLEEAEKMSCIVLQCIFGHDFLSPRTTIVPGIKKFPALACLVTLVIWHSCYRA